MGYAPDKGLPSEAEVVATLAELGGHASALSLCEALRRRGYRESNAQLAMQRATDRGGLRVLKDWTLSLPVDLSQVRVRMRDITFAGYCGDGARRWFVTHGIDLHDFMANGMAADEFIRRGDHLAEDVVRKKLEREHHG